MYWDETEAGASHPNLTEIKSRPEIQDNGEFRKVSTGAREGKAVKKHRKRDLIKSDNNDKTDKQGSDALDGKYKKIRKKGVSKAREAAIKDTTSLGDLSVTSALDGGKYNITDPACEAVSKLRNIVENGSKKKTEKKKKKSRENGENIEYANGWDNASDFSGNADDEGSVISAVLDEDICYQCGLSTAAADISSATATTIATTATTKEALVCDTHITESAVVKDVWNSVIMCDMCDAEYHLQCQKLASVPDGSFICLKCKQEQEHFGQLSFSTSRDFQLPSIPSDRERSIVYSPSRPLELAWEECLRKDLMVVANLLPYDVMKKLTHGTVEKKTSSGRVTDCWRGATVEAARRLNSSSCHDIIDRDGRYDMKLPAYVVSQLQLDAILEPVLSRLRTIMGRPAPQLRTHNVVFVPVGSGCQQWHVDDSKVRRKQHRYFTILVHLNPLDSNSGGTEVWLDGLKKGDLIRGRPGDALVFPGSMLHRGHANNGTGHRFFYYSSFACSTDTNAGGI